MEDDQIESVVRVVIAECLSSTAEDVTPEKNLVNDLGGDSLNLIEIAIELEERLSIQIPDDAIAKSPTVEQIIDYCRKEVNRVQTNQ